LEIIQAYSPFVRGGSLAEAKLIVRVEDKDGNTIVEGNDRRLLPAAIANSDQEVGPKVSVGFKARSRAEAEASQEVQESDEQRVLTAEAAYLSFVSLEAAVTFGTGSKARIPGVRVAGKTGTTNGYTDAWFIGMVPGFVCGAWLGFDDARKSMGSGATGGDHAAPLWRAFMQEALKIYAASDLSRPSGLGTARMDPETGQLIPADGNPGAQGVEIPVMTGFEPGSPGLRHVLGIQSESLPSQPGEFDSSNPSEVRNPGSDSEETTRGLRSLY
jgi:penicillin-binding protein 1A